MTHTPSDVGTSTVVWSNIAYHLYEMSAWVCTKYPFALFILISGLVCMTDTNEDGDHVLHIIIFCKVFSDVRPTAPTVGLLLENSVDLGGCLNLRALSFYDLWFCCYC